LPLEALINKENLGRSFDRRNSLPLRCRGKKNAGKGSGE